MSCIFKLFPKIFIPQDKEDKENVRGVKNAELSTVSAAPVGVAGSPLAFTPTSVMRKNAAERKDSDPRLSVPELKISNQVGYSLALPPNSFRRGLGIYNTIIHALLRISRFCVPKETPPPPKKEKPS
jgi:hypothetical protein